MILTFTDYIEPKTTANGKLTPAKAKASDGKTYVLARAVVEQVRNALGVALEVTTSSKSREYNGKQYTDYTVETAKHPVAAAGPESPPNSATVVTPAALQTTDVRQHVYQQPIFTVAPGAVSPRPDSRSDEINRQSARRDAVSLVVAGIFPPEHLWDLIDKLAAYTYHKEAAAPSTSAQQHLEAARQIQRDIRADYTDEDAVCPSCGRREYLKQWSGGWFCAKSKEAGVPGGCGYPARGERLDHPVSYGEWKQREASFRRPDAVVVSPQSHPTR